MTDLRGTINAVIYMLAGLGLLYVVQLSGFLTGPSLGDQLIEDAKTQRAYDAVVREMSKQK